MFIFFLKKGLNWIVTCAEDLVIGGLIASTQSIDIIETQNFDLSMKVEIEFYLTCAEVLIVYSIWVL